MKERCVTALGEVLIDFTEAGTSGSGQALYERNPGGAPANVAVAVARLGGRSAFIGKTGADGFGDFLRETLSAAGVITSYSIHYTKLYEREFSCTSCAPSCSPTRARS